MFQTRLGCDFTIILAVALLTFTGCGQLINDPGGGIVHVHPAYINANKPYTVVLECRAISGDGEHRFRDATLYYRKAGTSPYSEVKMKLVLETEKYPTFRGDLPPFESGVRVEYYVTYHFDQVKRSRYFPAVPVYEPQIQ